MESTTGVEDILVIVRAISALLAICLALALVVALGPIDDDEIDDEYDDDELDAALAARRDQPVEQATPPAPAVPIEPWTAPTLTAEVSPAPPTEPAPGALPGRPVAGSAISGLVSRRPKPDA